MKNVGLALFVAGIACCVFITIQFWGILVVIGLTMMVVGVLTGGHDKKAAAAAGDQLRRDRNCRFCHQSVVVKFEAPLPSEFADINAAITKTVRGPCPYRGKPLASTLTFANPLQNKEPIFATLDDLTG
ncbi:MAG: hypothetical protein ABSB61_11900 [Anaerolineales bacterium]